MTETDFMTEQRDQLLREIAAAARGVGGSEEWRDWTPQEGVTVNADGRQFAKIDVTGLSSGQVAGLRDEARAMQEGRWAPWWLGMAAAFMFAGCVMFIATAVYLK